MLNCRDFVAQQNACLDGKEATVMQRFSLKMHELMCHHCRRYLKQLKLVDSVCQQRTEADPDETTIRTNIEHIHKHNHSEN